MKSGTLPSLALPAQEVLEKHKKYEAMYGKNELFWGLGIECESYLEISKPVFVKPGFMINNHFRERYSVDYYTSYKKEPLTKALSQFKAVQEEIPLPVLVNSHVLAKMDASFEHQTLYKIGAPPNPKFQGKTIFEILKELRPQYFRDEEDKSFTFDGDSIEIITQNFYKGTIPKVIQELEKSRKTFVENLQACCCGHPQLNAYCEIDWASGNHGFAVMATNPNNLAIFNNGTYHINITLPSYLDQDGKVANWKKFESDHKNYIQYIQWLEPLLVANFGSPDPLAWLVDDLYSLGSQRCAMSRYIGLGTYDTNTMKRGKVLTVDLSGVRSSWYMSYHKNSGYIALNKVGLDVNFNKHWNHGVEIRFFDWFPEGRLPGLLKFLVFLGDLAVTRGCKEDPVTNSIWNEWMARVIQLGRKAGCNKAEAAALTNVLGISCMATDNLESLFADLMRLLVKGSGPCSQYFLDETSKKSETREKSEGVEVASPSSWWRCC